MFVSAPSRTARVFGSVLRRGVHSTKKTPKSMQMNRVASAVNPIEMMVDMDQLKATIDSNSTNDLPTAEVAHSPRVFKLSAHGTQFLEKVRQTNIKYDRGGKAGEGYLGVQEVLRELDNDANHPEYYSPEQRERLQSASADVQARMRIKISKQYLDHALHIPENAVNPNPILDIVMPSADEVADQLGESDPSNQNRYSPMDGLLHKYEMLLAYVSINCSSHCRYCYRSDLFSGISEKSKGDMDGIATYARTYNQLIGEAQKEFGVRDSDSGMLVHRENGETLLPIREILFSGGDALTLPNSTIARYLAMMAESGLKTVRFGTKEFIFNPSRFDANFFSMLDDFHEAYPNMRVEVVGHYTHPFELVDAKTDEAGEYLYDINETYQVRADLKQPLEDMNARRGWLGHFNQFPIIAGVNDRSDVLRSIIYLSNRLGITMHNIYACREIIGNSHFRKDNDIASQFELVQKAKAGLSGVENRGRLIMSTEYGKVEVVGSNGSKVYCQLNRFVHGNMPEQTIFFEVDNSKLEDNQFFWLTDDVVKSDALCDFGKSLFTALNEKDASFVRDVKTAAAAYITENKPSQLAGATETEMSSRPAIIKIAGASPLPTSDLSAWLAPEAQETTLSVDLAAESSNITLAKVLARHGLVEAACECSLSCSTCVGKVEAFAPSGMLSALPPSTEDELDLVDTVVQSTVGGVEDIDSLRATCCIQLKPGYEYRFTKA